MSETLVNLYRSLRVEAFPHGAIIEAQPAPEILYPDFEEKVLPNGNIRKADVQFANPSPDSDDWVLAGGGTSLFDRANVFKGKSWISFEIPEGTVIPESLVVRNTGFNDRFQATHYQIEVKARMMTVGAYKGALDNLARNAIARSVELGRLK
ncbi:hypothetical protein V8J88_23615 [Massilia sp. W12]|uniref:Tse2 family ADP-ribosyltransferase toxin n=1 Tax=Massilia sp. W12 TaxID=3126507 RepID=UPI0030CAAFC1